MQNVILHSDLNCFYASVEMNEHPELRGRKVAVCGSTENRHGIVLTASYPAKRAGVRTGMANWQAREVCRDLVTVDPHYELYLKYSRTVRQIYRRYTDELMAANAMDFDDLLWNGVKLLEQNPDIPSRRMFPGTGRTSRRRSAAPCGRRRD